MMKIFEGVRVLVWDLDGTLFGEKEELTREFRRHLYEIVAERLGVSWKEAKRRFERRQKKLWGTTITANSFGLDGYWVVAEVQRRIDWRRFLKRDERLVRWLGELKKSYRQILLTDNTEETAREKLKILGVEGVFEKWFCGLDLRVTKPDKRLFKMVLDYTGLPAKQHLMIGDRLEKDIEPAKAVGMKTWWVREGVGRFMEG